MASTRRVRDSLFTGVPAAKCSPPRFVQWDRSHGVPRTIPPHQKQAQLQDRRSYLVKRISYHQDARPVAARVDLPATPSL